MPPVDPRRCSAPRASPGTQGLAGEERGHPALAAELRLPGLQVQAVFWREKEAVGERWGKGSQAACSHSRSHRTYKQATLLAMGAPAPDPGPCTVQ